MNSSAIFVHFLAFLNICWSKNVELLDVRAQILHMWYFPHPTIFLILEFQADGRIQIEGANYDILYKARQAWLGLFYMIHKSSFILNCVLPLLFYPSLGEARGLRMQETVLKALASTFSLGIALWCPNKTGSLDVIFRKSHISQFLFTLSIAGDAIVYSKQTQCTF